MFSLLAILAILWTVGVAPTIATSLFSNTSRDDRESKRELLAIAVEVERPQHPGAHVVKQRTTNCDGVSTFDAAARRL
jgi:hypothetical protein